MSNTSETPIEPLDTLCQASSEVNLLLRPQARNPVIATIRHVHFPAGAVPKDGPSAGITIATALISLLTGRRARSRIAMSGELTLRGEVLPVGGLREKVVAAKAHGNRTVVVPAGNQKDIEEIPEGGRRGLTFVYADEYSDLIDQLLVRRPDPKAVPKIKSRSTQKGSDTKRTQASE